MAQREPGRPLPTSESSGASSAPLAKFGSTVRKQIRFITLRASYSCGAVHCNRSCLWVCDNGRAVSEPYYSQRARSVCVSLSASFLSQSIPFRVCLTGLFFSRDYLLQVRPGPPCIFQAKPFWELPMRDYCLQARRPFHPVTKAIVSMHRRKNSAAILQLSGSPS